MKASLAKYFEGKMEAVDVIWSIILLKILYIIFQLETGL